MHVAVLGASDKPSRDSYKAVRMLREKGHDASPVNPRLTTLDGLPAYRRLADVPRPIHTLAVYLSPSTSSAIADQILGCGAQRAIFPPGAENPGLEERLREKGVEVVEGCTMVMLSTGQF
jgi:hypothetical protein